MNILLTFFVINCGFWSTSFVTSREEDTCISHYETHKNPSIGDGGFSITIRDLSGRMADRFESGQNYRVIISSSMSGMIFQDFSLYTSLDIKDDMKMAMPKIASLKTLGNLVINKRSGKINDNCRNNVHGSGNKVHSRVEITWQAPENPVKCIKFQAQITKTMSLVFEDTGNLMKTLCPTKMHKLMGNMNEGETISKTAFDMPPMVKECCACGTASYKVTFKGLWSKETHPTDWPKHKSMLHWTNLIGATHSGNYFIYYNGGQASQAVQSICSYGDNTVLRQNFGSENVKPNLKSYFSTQGMWNEGELMESRSGLISVNRTHHLFSFLTMMGPSPDWCTGLPALDLCMQDCTWKNDLSFDLYPFDAGIKQGQTYMPLNSDRLDIPDPIKVINTTVMPEYPFTANMPVARLMIQKVLPVHDWQCAMMPAKGVEEFHSMAPSAKSSDQISDNGFLKKRQKPNANSPLRDPALAQMATFLCITSDWSLWTPCSVSCGVGARSRTKSMIKNLKNELCRHVPLTETESCEGRQRACDFSAPCSLLSWSHWGPCNSTCATDGVQHRLRMFARSEEQQSCLRLSGAKIQLTEYRQCRKDRSQCDPVTICSEGLVVGLQCGKPRTRFHYDAMTHTCRSFTYLGCKGNLNSFPSKSVCEGVCLNAVENLPQWRREKMALLQAQSNAQSPNSVDEKPLSVSGDCLLAVDHGAEQCNGSMGDDVRYYYDRRNLRCRQFVFSGCAGNGNNFATYGLCLRSCMPDKVSMMANAPKRDCLLSNWSSWSSCSSLCGTGKQWRWRSVIKPAMNGGKACSKLYSTQSCLIRSC